MTIARGVGYPREPRVRAMVKWQAFGTRVLVPETYA